MKNNTALPFQSQGSGSESLPCLFSNNSIEAPEKALDCVLALCSTLSPYWKKSAHTLYSNVSRLISLAPSIGHVGFLTLTFADNVTDHEEAYNRFRSFNTNFLNSYPEITHWLSVKERQKRGAWHYHLVVVLKGDIQEGINFEEFAQENYSSAPNYLRFMWRDLREACAKYKLGRSELLPIKSNAEGMARYLGKYISKHLNKRESSDKGVRLVNASRNWSKNSVNFAWYTEGSVEWRRKLALFAEYMGCTELYQLTEKLGTGWAFKYLDDIFDIDKTLECCQNSPIPHVSNTIKIIEENQFIFNKSKQITKHKKVKSNHNENMEVVKDYLQSSEFLMFDALLSEKAFLSPHYKKLKTKILPKALEVPF